MMTATEALGYIDKTIDNVIEVPHTLWRSDEVVEMLRELRGMIPAAVQQPNREALGEYLALTDDYDGCHARVREWEALEQWEKDAHPDEEPSSDREDAEFWNRRADRAIEFLAALPIPATPDKAGLVERLARELSREYSHIDWDTASDAIKKGVCAYVERCIVPLFAIPATGEVEWEYAAERVDAYGVVAERRDEMPDDAEALGDWRSVRRRKAGPWVEVTS